MMSPTCERADAALHGARIVSIYPAAGKVGPAALRRIFDQVLHGLDLAARAPDPLPERLLRRYALPRLHQALATLHTPGDDEDLALLNSRRSPAHLRLLYGEL